ncbi:MAG: GDP-mannose 4,6-dehydratase [Candidatus Nanoarchaeia archaeon]|nr:GDP-mannose 4,6-dehydratase [Candidatus Nanoarchaeia archaeon]MDD5741437.1 GDP-mannose 4,6-dehydratase [Candidatus Nanoarchaeia archaeon]
MKRALITGITGQDGSYLTEFLLDKEYEVHGVVRRSSTINRSRIDHLIIPDQYSSQNYSKKLFLHYGDLTDLSSIEKIVKEVQPDEIYNLGSQSHVRVSFDTAENTLNVTGGGALRILEAVKDHCPKAKFYQASSSEMFGLVTTCPQDENTTFHPRSPYACAKVFAYFTAVNYREAYNIFAVNGILFNHESERRGENFVTRKITRSLARIKVGLQHKLSLGNLNVERDWGYAKDYVKAMWLMLQQKEPEDFVVGTGEKHTLKEFLESSARQIGLDIQSNGKEGIDEAYLDKKGRVIIDINPVYFRPSEVSLLLANPAKARKKLGWAPEVKFEELVTLMCKNDLKLAEEELKNEK